MFGLRQRRNISSGSLSHSPERKKSRVLDRRKPGTVFIFLCLLLPRILSALYNIIHDCDEVYNYWEPLHFLLYGHGMQTWEYSSAYALRSYLYLLVHTLIAGPAALWLGAGPGKAAVFYIVRMALATISAYAEMQLVRAVRDFAGAKTAQLLLFLLCCSAGMFAASSAFLPSTFVMYTLTLAAAAVIDNHPRAVVAYAAVGVLLGWPVAGVAFVPYAMYVLTAAPFLGALGTAVSMSLVVLIPLVCTDWLFYGRWTVTLWNFLKYNVAGGGDSSLYGVESGTFYLRNAMTNLNLVAPLAILVPLSALFLMSQKRGSGVRIRLAIAVAPVWVWVAVISALPHKEERFLFPVYTLICLSAAMTLVALPVMVKGTLGWLLPRQTVQWVARLAPRLACGAIMVLSLSRVAALLLNYGAPLQVYRQLPEDPVLQPGTNSSFVCVGDEWHRFPSSFHLPHPAYRLAFVQSGFHGLLPRPFDIAQGGTAGAPEELNNRNEKEPRNYWPDVSQCQYYVGLQPQGGESMPGFEEWETIAQWPFVEQSKSPQALYRAFYVPQKSQLANHVSDYVILKKF
ncbi:g1047 [Coccomyxa viridis]|uniref:Mannosyltransferase n=1 Tax=Coccomyxa viridis TaxID=1274662 RepID=A0ABP1FIS1_9CHLO